MSLQMAGKLINVRLNADDAAKAEALRKQGANLSDLVRNAIRWEYAMLMPVRRRTRRDGAALLKKIRDIPIPPEDYPPPLDLTDRKAVQARIYESLASKRDSTRHQRNRRSA